MFGRWPSRSSSMSLTPRPSPRTKRRIWRAGISLTSRIQGGRSHKAKLCAESPASTKSAPTSSQHVGAPSPEEPRQRPQQRVAVRVTKAARLKRDASTYAKVFINGEWVGKTKKLPRTSRPHWGKHAPMVTAVPSDGPLSVTVSLREYSDEVTGQTHIDVRELLGGHSTGRHRGWHSVRRPRTPDRHHGDAFSASQTATQIASKITTAFIRVHVEIVVTAAPPPPETNVPATHDSRSSSRDDGRRRSPRKRKHQRERRRPIDDRHRAHDVDDLSPSLTPVTPPFQRTQHRSVSPKGLMFAASFLFCCYSNAPRRSWSILGRATTRRSA